MRCWDYFSFFFFSFLILLHMLFSFEMGSWCWKRVLFLFQSNCFLVCEDLPAYHHPPLFPPAIISLPVIILPHRCD